MPMKRSVKVENLTVHNRPATPLVPRHQVIAPMALMESIKVDSFPQTSQGTSPGSDHAVGLFWRCLFSKRRHVIPKLGLVQPPTPNDDLSRAVTAQPEDIKAKVVITAFPVRAAPEADDDDQPKSQSCCPF